MRVLSPSQIARIAYGAGFRGRGLTTAVAVALAESGGRPRVNAQGAEDSRGLWQINEAHFGRYDERRLYKAKYNARAAFDISERGRAWAPWSTYGNGAYREYVDDARRAVRKKPWETGRDGRGGGGGAGGAGGGRDGKGSRRDAKPERRDLAPWRLPKGGGAGTTGRIVVTPSFLATLAKSLTAHLAVVEDVDRRSRRRVEGLGLERLVVAGKGETLVRKSADAACEDWEGTRRLPQLLTRDVGYVIEAERRATRMDAGEAFGERSVDGLVGSLGKGTSKTSRRRVEGLLSQLGPDQHRRHGTSGKHGDREKGDGPGRDGSKGRGGGAPLLAGVNLGRRWGGGQSIFGQAITPFMRRRGLKAGSAKRGVIPGSSTASDHYVGNRDAYAVDYPTYKGEDDARALARRLGIEGWRPNSYQSFNVRVDGVRFRAQILWGAEIDHSDHVHVGFKRVS
jgi:hypothetical protein